MPWWNGKSHSPNNDKAIFSQGSWKIPFALGQITTFAWATSQGETLWDVTWRNRRMRTSTRSDACTNSCHTNYVSFYCNWQGLPGPIGVAGLVGPIGSIVSMFRNYVNSALEVENCLGNRKSNNLTLMLRSRYCFFLGFGGNAWSTRWLWLQGWNGECSVLRVDSILLFHLSIIEAKCIFSCGKNPLSFGSSYLVRDCSERCYMQAIVWLWYATECSSFRFMKYFTVEGHSTEFLILHYCIFLLLNLSLNFLFFNHCN